MMPKRGFDVFGVASHGAYSFASMAGFLNFRVYGPECLNPKP